MPRLSDYDYLQNHEHQNSGTCLATTCHAKNEVMERSLLIGAASQTRTVTAAASR